MTPVAPSGVPGYVVVGHVTKDLQADGSALGGGSALYSSLTAGRLGVEAAIVTALAAQDHELLALPAAEGIRYAVRPSPTTTTFANHYNGHHRWQEISNVAAPITPADVPTDWRDAPILHLGPVAQELQPDPAWFELFPTALIGATPQGWLRSWDAAGRVSPALWATAAQLLPHVHVLVMSGEDVGNDAELLLRYVRLAPLAVVTSGPDPATIYEFGRAITTVPAVAANPVDFTGAGDVFTAAFLVRYRESGDPVTAATFAHAVAASAIEAEGTAGIPGRRAVEQRLANT